ncbi:MULTISPECIES: hypothetical protein [Sphingobacterium]|uniref:hypothetical protein n=1 Tax=Sphingobacterium TaxID=28453 RepID=UPI00257FC8F5|nr:MULTISPECIES: hypothetical protein [Sphingobacterium]
MKIIILFLFFSVLLSCEKSVVDRDQSYDMIVEGGINTLYQDQYIELKRLNISSSGSKTEGISGAAVTVTNGPNSILFEDLGDGLYRGRLFNLKDTVNNLFQLKIESNGKIYEAQDQLIPIVPVEKSFIPVEKSDARQNWHVKVSTYLFGMRNSNKWLILPKRELSNESITVFKAPFSYSFKFGAPNVLNTLLTSTYSYEMSKKDSLFIAKFAISPRYAKFLYNLFQETKWKGLLSAVPANVQGNISGNALGYFYVMDGVEKTVSMKNIRDSK